MPPECKQPTKGDHCQVCQEHQDHVLFAGLRSFNKEQKKTQKTSIQPPVEVLDERPKSQISFCICPLITAFCSTTQRLFANFCPTWPTRQISLQWFPKLLLRFSHTTMQWILQSTAFLHGTKKLNSKKPPPRSLARTKQNNIRVSTTMTRGAALSRVSITKREIRRSSWNAVRIQRRDWLVSKKCWHQRACRSLSACCRKGVSHLKAIARRIRQSMVDIPWRLHRHTQMEEGKGRGVEVKKSSLIRQAFAKTSTLISRAITVATYALSLECGRMLALPTWLRIISAYSVAALVPTLLPSAHGDNCRVFTTISASALRTLDQELASLIANLSRGKIS